MLNNVTYFQITDQVRGGGRQVLRGDGRQVWRQVSRRRRRRLLLLVQEVDLLERVSFLPLLKIPGE